MKKFDLKKLALMGITGGVMLAQTSLSADGSTTYRLANQGCSSPHGCSGGNYNSNTGWTQGCASPSNSKGNNNGNVSWNGCSSSANYKNDTSWSQADRQRSWNDRGQDSDQQMGQDSQDLEQQQNRQEDQENRQRQEDQQSRQRQEDQRSRQRQDQSMNSSQPDTQMPGQMNPGNYQSVRNNPTRYFIADTATDANAKAGTMTEADLMKQLNDPSKTIYKSLSPEGKALALKLANQTCKAQNTCKGLNSCKTADHSCAGKGACAGTAIAPFKDKNMAVKIAAQKMAEKRASMNK